MLDTPQNNPDFWKEDKKINLNLPKEVLPQLDPMWRDAKVDIYSPPPPLNIAISIAHDKFGSVAFGSYGNISLLYGPPKSKKSYLKSAVVSSYIGGKANNYFENIWGVNNKDKYVIDVDTEQGLSHAWRTMRRVKDMCGFDKNVRYWPLSWAEYSPAERREGLRTILMDRPDMLGHYGLIVLDGVADFVDDVNNLKDVNELIHILMKGAKHTQAHILCILHCNYGSKKPTGHLGSAMLKKAETIAYVENETTRDEYQKIVAINKKIVDVVCMDTRNIEFDGFKFRIDEDGLPIKC